MVFREWRPEVKRHPRSRREKAGEEVSSMENSLDGARAVLASAAIFPVQLSLLVFAPAAEPHISPNLQITILSVELTPGGVRNNNSPATGKPEELRAK